MSQFDMSHQQVGQQYVAGRDISIGHVQSSQDVQNILEQLNDQIAQAQESGVINEDIANGAQDQVTKAIDRANNPDPDKKAIVDHLSTAKSLLETASMAGGLVTTLIAIIQAIPKLPL